MTKTREIPSSECPKCFGNPERFQKLPGCHDCVFLDSCRYYVIDPPENAGKRGLHHVSFERYGYSREVSTVSNIAEIQDLEIENSPEYYTSDDLQQLLEFVLTVDDYSMAIVQSAIDGNSSTASELAKKFHVSRQAMHSKIADTCRRYPAIGALLMANLCRCKSIRVIATIDRRKKQPQQWRREFQAYIRQYCNAARGRKKKQAETPNLQMEFHF